MNEQEIVSEVRNSNLNSRLEQLQTQVSQHFHMRRENVVKDEELFELLLKMSQKLKVLKRCKKMAVEYKEELEDKNNSLKRMKKHIRGIWNLLFLFRSKIEKIENLTAVDKKEFLQRYQDFLTLGISEINGNSEILFSRLNVPPENSTSFSISSEIENEAICTKNIATSSKDTSSSFPCPSVVLSSSSDSFEKNDQFLKHNTTQVPKSCRTENSSSYSPDTTNLDDGYHNPAKKSFLSVLSDRRKSNFGLSSKMHSTPLHFGRLTSHKLGKEENVHAQLEHSPEEKMCSLSTEMSKRKEFVKGFENRRSKASVMYDSSHEKEVSFKTANCGGTLSQSIEEDYALSENIMDCISRKALQEEESNEDVSSQMSQIGLEQDSKIKVQSSKNKVDFNSVSSEPTIEDLALSDDSLKVSNTFNKSMPAIQTGVSHNFVKFAKTKNLWCNDSRTPNEATSPRLLVHKKDLESPKLSNKRKRADSQRNVTVSSATKLVGFAKQVDIGNGRTCNKMATGEEHLVKLLNSYQNVLFTPETMEYHSATLVKVAINTKYSLDVPTLLFHILNYICKSKRNPLLAFLSSQNPSALLPMDENCIVSALFSMESTQRPHLEGLLRAALTTTHNLILSKKGFTLYGLAALCRFLTEICRRQGNAVNPVILCADLLKMRHRYASYLIASVTGVWPQLFQIGNNLQVEEMLFHSSILYGASKRRNVQSDNNWNSIVNVLCKYFTGAPPVNNAKSAICDIKKLIELRCTNNSWNCTFLASTLVILAAHEEWDWTEEHLLNHFIIPHLTKFASESSNEHAFELFCNLYVDFLLLEPQNSVDTVLTKFFKNSTTVNGKNFVRDSASWALMRYEFQNNRNLPSFIKEWFESNQQNLRMQQFQPIIKRRRMRENSKKLLLEDVLQNSEIMVYLSSNENQSKTHEIAEHPENSILNSGVEKTNNDESKKQSNLVTGHQKAKEGNLSELVLEEKPSTKNYSINVTKEESFYEPRTNKSLTEQSEEELFTTKQKKPIYIKSRKKNSTYKSKDSLAKYRNQDVNKVESLFKRKTENEIPSELDSVETEIASEPNNIPEVQNVTVKSFSENDCTSDKLEEESSLRSENESIIGIEPSTDESTADDSKDEAFTTTAKYKLKKKQCFRKPSTSDKLEEEPSLRSENESIIETEPSTDESTADGSKDEAFTTTKKQKLKKKQCFRKPRNKSVNKLDEKYEKNIKFVNEVESLIQEIKSEINNHKRAHLQKGKKISLSDENTADERERMPYANEITSESGSLYEPSTDEDSDDFFTTTNRKRNYRKPRNNLSTYKPEESCDKLKNVDEIVKEIKRKNETEVSKRTTSKTKKVQSKLFTSSIEDSTADEELITKAKEQNINKYRSWFKRKRIPSTTDESEQSPMVNKKIKVETNNSLNKIGTKRFTTKQFSNNNKTPNSGRKEISCKYKTKESKTEKSEDDPVLEIKSPTIKSMETFSNQSEHSTSEKPEEGLSTKSKIIEVGVDENFLEENIEAATSDKTKEWKSTQKYPKTSLKHNNSSFIPVKDIFDKKGLPEGWTRGRIVKKSGKSKGEINIYYYSSKGHSFCCKEDLSAYLKKTHSTLDVNVFDFSKNIWPVESSTSRITTL